VIVNIPDSDSLVELLVNPNVKQVTEIPAFKATGSMNLQLIGQPAAAG
jgi:hypothetical protein